MKVIEKITLIIYSNIILILSIILCLLIFGWLDMEFVGNIVNSILTQSTSSTIVLGISIIFILLSVNSLSLIFQVYY